MELAHYNQVAISLFRPMDGNIAYLENRLANLELVTRRGLDVQRLLSTEDKKHHVTDAEAKLIEQELDVDHGWLDSRHDIPSRKALETIRHNNLARLILEPAYKEKSKEFLSTILTSKPSQALYFLMYEVTFVDQSYYLRELEKFLELELCSLDADVI